MKLLRTTIVRRLSRPTGLLIAALCLLALVRLGYAGDILRGGATAGARKSSSSSSTTAGTDAANVATANAKDRLARTTTALNSVKNLQAAARAAAATEGVPDGLQSGGLQVLTGANAKWVGASSPSQSGSVVTINQNAAQAILHWETFNVGKNTTLKFDQSAGGSDASKWAAFNKVYDPSGKPSKILGQIKADGQVYVINRNGVIFGNGAQVNTRTLVASSLPINDNLIADGLLNLKSGAPEFLFSALPTGTFTPGGTSMPGDVIVEAGAVIASSVSDEGYGGRVMLVGPRVVNQGEISTPAGQTILAAGLQAGFAPHSSTDSVLDPSGTALRGLDAYIGAVSDASLGQAAAEVINEGFISADRGNITMVGKTVSQKGMLSTTTSVDVNGRIDLLANYGAVSNTSYDPSNTTSYLKYSPFLNRSTGTVAIGEDSVMTVLPEWDSDKTIASTSLSLRSQVNIQGLNVYFGQGSILLAPSGDVKVRAGNWNATASSDSLLFVNTAGQIYFDTGSLVDVSGSTDVFFPLANNILTIQLRGSELADSPLQRSASLRAVNLTVDLRKSGNYYGRDWVGTPLGDLTGYLNLVERNVAQLTMEGGDITLAAGASVVVREGAVLDASGGYARNEGGFVQTTRLRVGGTLLSISDATPDRVYGEIYTGQSTKTSAKWGVSSTYANPLAPLGGSSQQSYISGANAGTISISAASMALDGDMSARSIAGPNQLRNTTVSSSMPDVGKLSLSFEAQDPAVIAALGSATGYYSPTPPTVIFQADLQKASDPGSFSVDANGLAAALSADRQETVILSPGLLQDNFGELVVKNVEGDIVVAKGTTLEAPPVGLIDLSGANVTVEGDIVSHGGTINLSAYTYSPYLTALRNSSDPLPLPDSSRGTIRVAAGAHLDAADTLVNDLRDVAITEPVPSSGGTIKLQAFSITLEKGSSLDVSGGAVVGMDGSIRYGDAGSISILAGRDPELTDLVGGRLVLDADLRGYSVASGGSLAIQSQYVRIGNQPEADAFNVTPEFFSQGGFATITLQAIGGKSSLDGTFRSALEIAPGTIIEPQVLSYQLTRGALASGSVEHLDPLLRLPGLRDAANLTFSAAGATDSSTGEILAIGDIRLGQGAEIRVDPGGTVTLSGEMVDVQGSIWAPGGAITIKGGSQVPTSVELPTAYTTVFISSRSVLSAAGVAQYLPDVYGRRIGTVYDGGTITVSGNIVAEQGAILDVSGASGIVDYSPQELGLTGVVEVPVASGVTSPLFSLRASGTLVESNGGTIDLSGSALLLSDAILRGFAGGSSALGGTLKVSSGRYYLSSEAGNTAQTNIIVKSDGSFVGTGNSVGSAVVDASGATVKGMGYFAATSFSEGGFSSLKIGGNVEFVDDVAFTADSAIWIGSGGVIRASGKVSLTAPYVKLGQEFPEPVPEEDQVSPFLLVNINAGQAYNFSPTAGTGQFNVNAQLIDVGTTVLDGISTASLTAADGDVRGNGIFVMSGDLTITAGQVYPSTAAYFDIFVYDNGSTAGSVNIVQSGIRPVPLEGGGSLRIMASTINQSGTLRSTLGSISLGWDGLTMEPTNLVVGTVATTPVTDNLILGSSSVTTVSAIDPTTGEGLLIPYGTSPDGLTWYAPDGTDITLSGLPEKSISISAQNLQMTSGATVDIRGGGDFYAYEWIQGNGGSTDILASSDSYAIIPGYQFSYAPYAPFNTDTDQAAGLLGDTGYYNSNLLVGSSITVVDNPLLPAGTYTLLPARYALLPGAYLVTASDYSVRGSLVFEDGSAIVSGYSMSGLTSKGQPATYQSYEVLSWDVIRQRSEYVDFTGNVFLGAAAAANEQVAQRLAQDAGKVSFLATTGLDISGTVLAQVDSGGRGAIADIASQGTIIIGESGNLNPSVLNSWGIESLLIGGYRDGSSATVRATNVTLSSGSVLSGPEIILAATQRTEIASGAAVLAVGSLTSPNQTLSVNGDGSLVMVSGDQEASILRTGFTGATTAHLVVDDGAFLSGASLTLDSSYDTDLSELATLASSVLSLNSGRVSVLLNNPGTLQADADKGVILSGNILAGFANSDSVTLTSYSSVDFYGTGTFSLGDSVGTRLRTGQIRGFNLNGGTVTITAADLLLDNSQGAKAGTVAAVPDGTLDISVGVLRLGKGDISLSNFANVSINASGGIHAAGIGSLSTNVSMVVNTPGFTADGAASQALKAGGDLIVNRSGSLQTTSGLGAQWLFSGLSVDMGADVILPSGLATFRSKNGSVRLGGLVDVSGATRTFYDVVRTTAAGAISIDAQGGDAIIESSAILDVRPSAEGTESGEIGISTSGQLDLQGSLLAGASGTSGSFSLDAGSIANFDDLNARLAAGSFFESRSFRARTGDLLLSSTAKARSFTASADAGNIVIASGGVIDASGETGGEIILAANGNVVLQSGSLLTVRGEEFSSDGKGGSVSLQAGSSANGIAGTGRVTVGAGSTIDLGVDAASRFVSGGVTTPGSAAFYGYFEGTLHLRAPQTADATGILIDRIEGNIINPSAIMIEGYRIFDLSLLGGNLGAETTTTTADDQPLGGLMLVSDVLGSIRANGNLLAANETAIRSSIVGGAAFDAVTVIGPGAELINLTQGSAMSFTLSTVNSTIAVQAGGGTIEFPNGTGGNNLVRTSAAGVMIAADGTETTFAANATLSVAAGSKLVYTASATVTFASGTGGPITVGLQGGGVYRTAASGSTTTINTPGASVLLRTANSSGLNLTAGSVILLPSGSGTSTIKSTVAGTLISPTGTVTSFAANTSVSVPAGTRISLVTSGTITYTGSAQVTANLVSGSMTTANVVDLMPAGGDISLGSATTAYTSDWDLSTLRFGSRGAPGILTFRAAGDVIFNNSLSDGFDPVVPNTSTNPTTANGNNSLWLATPTILSSLLPANLQSWSYNIIAGADLSSAALDATSGSTGDVLIGKIKRTTDMLVSDSSSSPAYTFNLIRNSNAYQVVRTGTGDINITASNDVLFRNPLASVYTAGVQLPNAANLFGTGDFSIPQYPIQSPQTYSDAIGVKQQTYGAYYTIAGGDLSIIAGRDIRTVIDYGGVLVNDTSRQMPDNWLYRRGYVDASGVFGAAGVQATTPTSVNDPSASTTWWVDFSNFFMTAATLGGGDLTISAGRDLINIDGSVATNARMASGTPDASKLVELGGGDLIVEAGRDISGGTYYVERGSAAVSAGRDITTNSARSPSLGIYASSSAVYLNSYTYLPTTYFVGRASLDISARGNILMGTVANTQVLPAGLGNGYWYKSYFFTYSPETSVNVLSLGGDITLRTEASAGTGANPTSSNILELWYANQLVYNKSGSGISRLQPWLRLSESSSSPFATAMSVFPSTLRLTALAGSVTLGGEINLFPSSTGTLEIVASDDVNGMAPVGISTLTGGTLWRSAQINLSDADPALLPSITDPYAYQQDFGRTKSATVSTQLGFLNSIINSYFDETGSFSGPDAATSIKQALHASGILHSGDTEPLRLYSGGDIIGLTLFAAKQSQIYAAGDITDISFYIQNTDADSVSIVSAGGDITPYNANSSLRLLATSNNGRLLDTAQATNDFVAGTTNRTTSNVLAGDIQISGPGSLQLIAGGSIDLGTGPSYFDGTGTGITSIGQARNPYLPFSGADIYILAGVGASGGLASSDLEIDTFLEKYESYIEELGILGGVESLDPAQRAQVALQILPLVLRDTGRAYATTGSYQTGFDAISSLFGETSATHGDLNARTRDIRTRSGGLINISLPHGDLILSKEVERAAQPTLASFAGTDSLIRVSNSTSSQAPSGIVTEYGGNISIFTEGDVDIGRARIFTLRGGNIVIWSSTGDIAAGAASKTVSTAPPTRVVIDPVSGAIETDLSGLATGGGIGVLSTVKGVEPGDVDLIAPEGVVDAGDAGIRSSGNLNIAATQVLNADNISVSGSSTGVPTSAPVAAPNIAGLASAASATGAANSASQETAQQSRQQTGQDETPSIITVDVLGYGGGDEAAMPDMRSAPAPGDQNQKRDDEDEKPPAQTGSA